MKHSQIVLQFSLVSIVLPAYIKNGTYTGDGPFDTTDFYITESDKTNLMFPNWNSTKVEIEITYFDQTDSSTTII